MPHISAVDVESRGLTYLVCDNRIRSLATQNDDERLEPGDVFCARARRIEGGDFAVTGSEEAVYHIVAINVHPRDRTRHVDAGGDSSLTCRRRYTMLSYLWSNEDGQDIAEYAVMLAVILVLVVGTIRLIGSNANNVFSQSASAIQ